MDSVQSDILTGGGIVLSATAVLKLAELAFTAWRTRNQKTEIAPNPLSVEQTANQALWKANEKDHADVFARLHAAEANVAALAAEVNGVKTMQGRMFDMITALYDKIICGKGRK